MRKVALTINSLRYKTKDLDDKFVDFVEESMVGGDIDLYGDNSAEKLFIAYLKLAGKLYENEKEIEKLLLELE